MALYIYIVFSFDTYKFAKYASLKSQNCDVYAVVLHYYKRAKVVKLFKWPRYKWIKNLRVEPFMVSFAGLKFV